MPTDASLAQAVFDAARAYNTALANAEAAIRTAQTNLTAATSTALQGNLTMTLKSDNSQPLKHPVDAGYDPFLGRIKSVIVSRVESL